MNHVSRLLFAATLSSAAFLPSGIVRAAGTLDSAEVTRVYNKVELLPQDRAAVPAKVGDDISGTTAVQTGGQSRAELQFNDQTLARLGANSVFSFDRGTRDLNLEEGVMLLEVPKKAGGATINTAAVTAAVTGTTVMIKYKKGKTADKDQMKFIVLEGKMKLKLKGKGGKTVTLGAGDTISMKGDDKSFPEIQQVDVGELSKTSNLMNGGFKPLKNEPYILQTMSKQQVLKSKGKLIKASYSVSGKHKNSVLQVINASSQSSLRTDAIVPGSNKPQRVAAARSAPQSRPQVNRNTTPSRPVVPPKRNVPNPPAQPPKPKPQPPVQPPPVPPAPSLES